MLGSEKMTRKMKDKTVFVAICVVLGIILSIQFKTATNTTGKGVTPRQREKELKEEYENVLEKKEKLQDILGEVDSEIKKYEEVEKEKDDDIKVLYNELEKYKMFVGFETVRGPGITIEINEPSLEMEIGQEDSLVFANYDLILQLISKLNDLGAEAISINGERYTNYTSFEPYDKFLKVNDTTIQLPLEIKVLGDPIRLENGLNVRGNIMWNMQNKYLYNIKIQRKNQILIPEYTKPLELDHAKPVENED